MTLGGGTREVGIRLKVGAAGTENLDKLATALQGLGVDTAELDRRAEELSRELVKTGGAGSEAAVDQDKLAEAAAEASKAAEQLAEAAKSAATGTGELGSNSEGAKAKLGDMKLELAAAAATAYTIGRALGGAAKDASEFEGAMAEVATLVDDTSGLTAQAEAVRALAREYGGNAPEQAKALYQIISAGAKEGAEATGLLDAANKLAVGGVTDITTAANGLTSILNAYGKEAGTATEVSDALFVAMKAGKTTVGELSGGIGQVAPIASQAGVGLDQLLAATAALTKGGSSTSESFTQLRGIISAVIKPTAEAQEVARSLGLQFDAQALKAKNLSGFLEDVRQKTGGNTEVMAKLFGGVESLGGVLALTGNQAGSFSETLEGMEKRTGATDEAFQKISKTSGFAAKQFTSAFNDIQISLGQALTALTPLLRVVTQAINEFNELPADVKTATLVIGGAVAALVPLAVTINALSKAAGLAAGALGLKALALRSVGAAAVPAVAGIGAVGAASATAAVPIGFAAAAVTRLRQALQLLIRATPLGIVAAGLTFIGAKLLDWSEKASAAADESEKAADAANALDGASKRAAAGVDAAGTSAEKAAAKIEDAGTKARVAASALGVDLAGGAKSASLEFQKTVNQVDDLVGGLDALKKAGVDTGRAVSAALSTLVDGAKNTAELELVRKRIEALGKAGEVSEREVARLMESVAEKAVASAKDVGELDQALKALGIGAEETSRILAASLDKELQAAKTERAVKEVIAQLEKLGKQGRIAGDDLAGALDKARGKLDALQPGINSLEEALKKFGLTSKAEATKLADEFGQAWALIRNDATVSLAQKQAAFTKYANAAIEANGGVADSQIKVQAEALKLGVEVDKTGKAVVRAMSAAAESTRPVRDGFKEVEQATQAVGDRVEQLQQQYVKLQQASGDAYREQLRAMGGLRGEDYLTGRNAQVTANGLPSVAAGTSTTRTADGRQLLPPQQPGTWQFVDDARVAYSGRVQGGGSTQGITGYWVNTAPPRQATPGAAVSPFGGPVRGQGVATPDGRPLPAPSTAPAPNPAPSPAPASVAFPSAAQPVRVVQLNLNLGGETLSAFADEQFADRFMSRLQDASRQQGGP